MKIEAIDINKAKENLMKYSICRDSKPDQCRNKLCVECENYIHPMELDNSIKFIIKILDELGVEMSKMIKCDCCGKITEAEYVLDYKDITVDKGPAYHFCNQCYDEIKCFISKLSEEKDDERTN